MTQAEKSKTRSAPIFYKLTDQDGYSGQRYTPVQWGIGVTHTTSAEGDMPGAGWVHVYANPLQAAFFNAIHADFDLSSALLWECQCRGYRADHPGIKHGFTSVTTLRTVPIPAISLAATVRCGIEAAFQVHINNRHRVWSHWAYHWLDGSDRSVLSARLQSNQPPRQSSRKATDAALLYANQASMPFPFIDGREQCENAQRELAALAVTLSMDSLLPGSAIDTVALIETAIADEAALEQKLSDQTASNETLSKVTL